MFVVQGRESSCFSMEAQALEFSQERLCQLKEEDGSSRASVSFQSALLTGMPVSKDFPLVANGLGSSSKVNS